MKRINSRSKGKAGEREVIGLLQPVVDRACARRGEATVELRRNLEQVRSGGSDVEGIAWLALEVKRAERLQRAAWWRQAVAQAGPTRLPVVVYRGNRQPWRVLMQADILVAGGDCHVGTLVELEWEGFVRWLERMVEVHGVDSFLTGG